jgi:hypothetical protein
MEGVNNIPKIEKPANTVDNNKIAELTTELLETNFLTWKKKLQNSLEIKFPIEENREKAMREAQDFIDKLPLYNCMRLAAAPFFANNPVLLNTSDLRLRVKNISDISVSGTNDDDIRYGRDKYIFFTYGNAVLAGNDRLAVAVNPSVLDREGTLVSLEDLSMIRFRVKEEDRKSLSWDHAWEQQKKEIWRGTDFKELFPYFIAISFDDPVEYYSKPLDSSFFEISRNGPLSQRDKTATFEIMVPGNIGLDEILFFGVGSESGFYRKVEGLDQFKDKINKPVIAIKKDVRGEELSRILNGAWNHTSGSSS